ncbi:hypothetical protein NEUTE1DRAFT_45521 [Neurospora tetrasperma FGSC 2508]|uniref:Uncharacterized protein n=1 Tax=Neurospora tetrasperma (strain FGSC 2508 / ATCC MYA-4615 / P0657) TaxID=510951 RepID=F8MP20_NEUT8|nr:uncharacterized protein NEUTE1DRAFT_45521 [Neurospora tetrasperma FGSC 2508]EGO56239.1 hypothetical protein NEUTE1DRAFT_45521 [Neurospora tetrasperma FGSC 2508]EGZ70908.1 hypothetical protein NEUTE2DRAFT_68447 [Neurospora tetrasperma FGSC 2509]
MVSKTLIDEAEAVEFDHEAVSPIIKVVLALEVDEAGYSERHVGGSDEEHVTLAAQMPARDPTIPLIAVGTGRGTNFEIYLPSPTSRLLVLKSGERTNVENLCFLPASRVNYHLVNHDRLCGEY